MSAKIIEDIVMYVMQCSFDVFMSAHMRGLLLRIQKDADNLDLFYQIAHQISNTLLASLHSLGFLEEGPRLLRIACEVINFRTALHHDEQDVRGLIARIIRDNEGE